MASLSSGDAATFFAIMHPSRRKVARISQGEWCSPDHSYSLPSVQISHETAVYPDETDDVRQRSLDMEENRLMLDYSGLIASSSPLIDFESSSRRLDPTLTAHDGGGDDDDGDDNDAAAKCVVTPIGGGGEPSLSTSADDHNDGGEEPIKTRFSDIIGHSSAKLRIEEILLPSALPPHLADSILTGVRALSASILLHGPPGCGKTQLAQAIAGESQASFMAISPSDILSKFVGESEASMRDVFDKAYERASEAESKCTVLFFDEIDALGQSRGSTDSGGDGSANAEQGGGDGCSRRVLAELLIQMNRITSSGGCREARLRKQTHERRSAKSESHQSYHDTHKAFVARDESPSSSVVDATEPRPRVIVVGATNRPEDCDQALLRRFGIRVYVGLPGKRDRKRIVSRLLRDVEHSLTPKQLEDVAIATEGWSGSDLEYLTREAAMAPIRACIQAASLVKRRAQKRQQRGGDESSQERGSREDVDPNNLAREKLLSDFESLRPINLDDFEHAIQFFLGKENESTPCVETFTQNRRHQEHYDSSSDEDD